MSCTLHSRAREALRPKSDGDIFLKNGDLVSGAVLAGLGVFIVVEARKWEYLAPDGPGPRVLPDVVRHRDGRAVAGGRGERRSEARPRRRERRRSIGAASGARSPHGARLPRASRRSRCSGFSPSFALLTFFIVAVMYRRPRRIRCRVGGRRCGRVLPAVPAGAQRRASGRLSRILSMDIARGLLQGFAVALQPATCCGASSASCSARWSASCRASARRRRSRCSCRSRS